MDAPVKYVVVQCSVLLLLNTTSVIDVLPLFIRISLSEAFVDASIWLLICALVFSSSGLLLLVL